ncbi:nitrile hydratase accessory protein [Roseibium sediminis]|uniref:nitrile hydratase accessory protein n=1 Tax=Roseibium sediminis TaxID=1775174 RepID=UPI00123D5BFF|nr:nitrile hydratase accessory protein [Roseibium sediminis]
MTSPDLLAALPAIPKDDGGPVFAAPWEARVFAMTIKAHEAGLFSWNEWAETLGAELHKDDDLPLGTAAPGYYDHWLAAFEKLLTAKGVATGSVLSDLKSAWDNAAKSTPHGQPIVLER